MEATKILIVVFGLTIASFNFVFGQGGNNPPQNATMIKSFKNNETGDLLDANTEGNVYTLTSNGGDYQKWVLIYVANDEFYLKNLATNQFLESEPYNGNVYTIPFDSSDFQKWKFDGHKIINVGSGWILNATTNHKVITAEDSCSNSENWIQV